MPLVDRGGFVFKLLRFACAVACRTFSADDTGLQVIVRPCHVDWSADLLRREYSQATHGYLSFSQYERSQHEVTDEKAVRQEILRAPYPRHLAERMVAAHGLDTQDFQDWCSWSREEASIFIGMLVRNNALRREGHGYKKTPALIKLLREVAAGPPDAEVPAHITRDQGVYG